MKSFLKKLGESLLSFAQLSPTIGAIIKPFLPANKAGQVATTVINDLTAMSQEAIRIEVALAGKPGPEKLAALIPLIGTVLSTSELVSGKHIENKELYNKAIAGYAQATVDLCNAISENEVKTV